MTHDPFQAYATLGAYNAVPNPLAQFMGQPNYGPYQTGIHPLAALQQQLQLASILGAQNPLGIPQNPWAGGLQQTPQIHPLAQMLGLQAGLTQPGPYGQGVFGQGNFGSPYGQPGSPFAQTGLPLAPQTWIGQGGIPGQIHPLLQQLVARALSTPGIPPGVGF